MAKKDPTDLTVEEKLKNLYHLQTVLSKIDEVRAYRGELPLEVQDLEDEIQGLNTRVTKLENEIDEFNNAITQKKGDDFMRFHTEQGLGLIVFYLLTLLLGKIWGWVGTVGSIICVIGTIKGIVSVLNGKRDPLPVIGDIVRAVKEKMAKRK